MWWGPGALLVWPYSKRGWEPGECKTVCEQHWCFFISSESQMFPIKLYSNRDKKRNPLGMLGAVSQAELGGVSCLTDENTETFWESDGMQGQHWIRLHMKRGTVVKWASEQFTRRRKWSRNYSWFKWQILKDINQERQSRQFFIHAGTTMRCLLLLCEFFTFLVSSSWWWTQPTTTTCPSESLCMVARERTWKNWVMLPLMCECFLGKLCVKKLLPCSELLYVPLKCQRKYSK